MKQTLFCCDASPFSINMNTTTFKDHGVWKSSYPLRFKDLLCNKTIMSPIFVAAIYKPTPTVETPINACNISYHVP
eukprot:Gb_25458 [translate_table: standard]